MRAREREYRVLCQVLSRAQLLPNKPTPDRPQFLRPLKFYQHNRKRERNFGKRRKRRCSAVVRSFSNSNLSFLKTQFPQPKRRIARSANIWRHCRKQCAVHFTLYNINRIFSYTIKTDNDSYLKIYLNVQGIVLLKLWFSTTSFVYHRSEQSSKEQRKGARII